MTLRLRIYEILAFPAHMWLHVVVRLCDGKFECGPVDHPDDPLGD